MNSDINIRNKKDKLRQKLFFFSKFYLNVIKIQRIYRKFKAKAKSTKLNDIRENDFPKNVI